MTGTAIRDRMGTAKNPRRDAGNIPLARGFAAATGLGHMPPLVENILADFALNKIRLPFLFGKVKA